MDKSESKKTEVGVWYALGLAWQLGYTIAIPLVVLALLGRFADKYWHTSPWLLLVGIFLSLGVSTFAVYRKTMKIMAETEEEIKRKEKEDGDREVKEVKK